MIKICHMTDVHPSFDSRIFLKECISLKQAGYETYLVAPGNSCKKEGIHIIGCGRCDGRIKRIVFFAKKIYKRAVELDCDVYHIHDPELLRYALKLKRIGKKVIFDSHEDIPAQILDKPWLPCMLRKMVSHIYYIYETYIIKQIDAVVAATPYIAQQLKGRTQKIVIVNNYPRLDDIVYHDTSFKQRKAVLCYAGGISKIRGQDIMTDIMTDTDAVLMIAGDHISERIGKIEYMGQIDRKAINELYGKAIAGLVLLLPTANYIHSLPIKMFEYMAAGLPFVASDFPLWKEIVNTYHCGLCVPVTKKEKVQQAVSYLLSHRDEAEQMGRNGRKAVEEIYNWNHEKLRLIGLYRELTKEKGII